MLSHSGNLLSSPFLSELFFFSFDLDLIAYRDASTAVYMVRKDKKVQELLCELCVSVVDILVLFPLLCDYAGVGRRKMKNN